MSDAFRSFSRSKSRGRPTNGRDRQRGESRGKRLREIDERVVKLAPVDRKPAVELVEGRLSVLFRAARGMRRVGQGDEQVDRYGLRAEAVERKGESDNGGTGDLFDGSRFLREFASTD